MLGAFSSPGVPSNVGRVFLPRMLAPMLVGKRWTVLLYSETSSM